LKLLFDQNISFRILPKILECFPDSAQVHELNLANKTDKQVWQYAKSNGFSIVTFDADFNDLATLFGHPPKIIWLRLGNTSTQILSEFMIEKQSLIKDFISNPLYKDLGCLEFDYRS
jgi:predicted nuclease of predicted toxin-antitoxin system